MKTFLQILKEGRLYRGISNTYEPNWWSKPKMVGSSHFSGNYMTPSLELATKYATGYGEFGYDEDEDYNPQLLEFEVDEDDQRISLGDISHENLSIEKIENNTAKEDDFDICMPDNFEPIKIYAIDKNHPTYYKDFNKWVKKYKLPPDPKRKKFNFKRVYLRCTKENLLRKLKYENNTDKKESISKEIDRIDKLLSKI